MTKTKATLHKVNQHEKAESYVPDEGNKVKSQKQWNEMEIGNFPEKEFRIMIWKMIQDLRKRMEAKIKKMQEMFTKNLKT